MKVLDFGLAKLADPASAAPGAPAKLRPVEEFRFSAAPEHPQGSGADFFFREVKR